MATDAAASGAIVIGSVIFGIVLICVGLGAYALPTIVAYVRKHRNLPAIALVNLLFGWSGLGWIIAMIWSLTSPQATPQTVIVHQTVAGVPTPTSPTPPQA